MGYRSQVAVAVKDDAFQEALSKEGADLQEEVRKCLEQYTDETIHQEGWTLYYWNDTKWYADSPGYGEVKWLEEFIKGSPWHGQLLRLGEELGDYDELGEAPDSPFEMGYECKLTYSY